MKINIDAMNKFFDFFREKERISRKQRTINYKCDKKYSKLSPKQIAYKITELETNQTWADKFSNAMTIGSIIALLAALFWGVRLLSPYVMSQYHVEIGKDLLQTAQFGLIMAMIIAVFLIITMTTIFYFIKSSVIERQLIILWLKEQYKKKTGHTYKS